MEKDLGPESSIARLENGGTNQEGKEITFEIITKDDKPHPFWCATADAWKIVHFVLSLSQFATTQGGGLKKASKEGVLTTQPISAFSFGLAPGRTDDEVVFAVHIGTDNPVTFVVQPNELAALRDLLNKHLQPTEGRRTN